MLLLLALSKPQANLKVNGAKLKNSLPCSPCSTSLVSIEIFRRQVNHTWSSAMGRGVVFPYKWYRRILCPDWCPPLPDMFGIRESREETRLPSFHCRICLSIGKKDVSQSGVRMFLLEWSLCWIFKMETSGGLRGGGEEGEGKERTTPVSYGLNCVSYSPQSSSEIKSKMLHHTFLYISFPSLLDYDVKMPWKCLIFVLWRTVNKLLFLNLSPVPRSQLQGNSPTFHIFSELE